MVGVRPLMSVFRPMLAKKTGRKEGIAADVHTALDVGRIFEGAEHDARDVSARDVGDAEILLRDVGHGKAEGEADDGDALGVGVAMVQPEHGLVDDEADDDGCR